MIKEVTGLEVESVLRSEIRVSGSLENHYAPEAKVLLDITPEPGDGFIALADIPTPPGVIRLAEPKSDESFAYLLYAALRDGDAKGLKKIVVTQPQGDGIAIAIRDRLLRAAAGR
jgi:L-threonylcarbamoyladenylate synthase